MEKTVVALFDNLDTAQTAVRDLLNNGFGGNDISVVRTNQQDDYTSGNMIEASEKDASGAAAGAGIGAVLGGLAGLLVGLGALAIPGIGPIIAAGPLATALAGAGLGAATGGLVGALADAGIPEHEASNYAEGVRRGGTLVTVRADEDKVTQANEILNRFTPVDIGQRADEWHEAGVDASGVDARVPRDMRGEPDRSPEGYRTQMGMTGENSGGTYEGTGSAGYTGSGTTYQGSGSFTSNTGVSDGQGTESTEEGRNREGYSDTGAVYGGGNSFTNDMDRPNTSDMSESPDRVGRSNSRDEDTVTSGDAVMRSGHGEMSTSTGYSGQGGGTYERMQDTDPNAHPRSSEGDYQARRDFLGGPESQQRESTDNTNSIQSGRGSYGSQGQNFQPGQDSDSSSSKGKAWEGQYGGHQGALAGGESFTGGASGDDMGTTGMTFRSGPSRSRFNRRFEDYEPDFRMDWETNYRSTGFGYERFQPAYLYGWQLGEQYQGRDWNDFEANARTNWEQNYPNDAWQDFRGAVRQGWQQFNEGEIAQPMDPEYDRTIGDMSRGFDVYDRDFRSDWDRCFRSTGYGYERYQPAYQYGYNLATDAKYRNEKWSDVEANARRDWETRHPNDAWDDFKDAVRHAWDRVRRGVQGASD